MQSAADQALQAGRQLVETPPEALIRLVRMVVRAFYSPEHAVIVDCLVKRIIVKEEDMTGMFRLDLKQLRQLLVALKQDKLISSRKGMETTADGRVSKYEYFFINYEVFVNVVKYKLDTMQHRLEREQREFTARAAFHCSGCGKTFTDLEVNQLMDFATGELKCTFCTAEVVEEENMATRQDLRTTVAKFHEQVRDPLDALLKELERFRFGSSLTEPPLTDAHLLAGGERPDGVGAGTAGGGGAANSNSSTITVDMAGSDAGGKPGAGVKEVPLWMLGSALTQDDDSNSRFSLDGGGASGSGSTAGAKHGVRKDEIHELLIQHEIRPGKKHPGSAGTAAASGNSATSAVSKSYSTAAGKQATSKSKKRSHSKKKHKNSAAYEDLDDLDLEEEGGGSSTSQTPSDTDDSLGGGGRSSAIPSKRFRRASENSDDDVEDESDVEDDDEDDEDGNEDEGDDELAVTFRGDRIPYDEITEEMVQQMTPAEKQEYAAVGQKFYAQFAD